MERVGKGLHFAATLMVAIGTFISAFWILSVNSWMQTPVGWALNEVGQFVPSGGWLEIIFNPSFPYRLDSGHQAEKHGQAEAFESEDHPPGKILHAVERRRAEADGEPEQRGDQACRGDRRHPAPALGPPIARHQRASSSGEGSDSPPRRSTAGAGVIPALRIGCSAGRGSPALGAWAMSFKM